MKRKSIAYLLMMTTAALTSACSTMKSVLLTDVSDPMAGAPIHNPFGDYAAGKSDSNEAMILRTKKGDRAIEVELPKSSQNMTDFVIPVAPAFNEPNSRAPASVADGNGPGGLDDRYRERAPSISDREILTTLPQGTPENEGQRREIEQGLGLSHADDASPQDEKSYLASMDYVKQLYRAGRYEAALIENDSLIQKYQTDAKLYEMRGTLLDRLGKNDLALKSWNQALRFDPKNLALRRFVERKQKIRGVAGQ